MYISPRFLPRSDINVLIWVSSLLLDVACQHCIHLHTVIECMGLAWCGTSSLPGAQRMQSNLNSSDIFNHGSLTALKRHYQSVSQRSSQATATDPELMHRFSPGQAIFSAAKKQIIQNADPGSLLVFACGANLEIALCAFPNIPVRT